MSRDPLCLTLGADSDELRDVRRQVATWLREAGVDGTVNDAVILATHEAAAAAIDRSAGPVTIRGILGEAAIEVVVSGPGEWTSELDMDMHGARNGLIRGVMTDVSSERDSARTALRLTKKL